MTMLQQCLEGVSTELHSHKVIELLQSPSTKGNPKLFNHAIQYLRMKGIKGDVEAKIKLGTILNGQLDLDSDAWRAITDKREADLWGHSLFDRWLSSAMSPCFVLVEANLISNQNQKKQQQSNKNGDTRDKEESKEEEEKEVKTVIDDGDQKQESSDATNSITYFRLVDAILSAADKQTGDENDNDKVNGTKIKGEMCYLVGLMRLKGVGLEKDLQQAVMYFKRASQLDHDGASYQLAMMMEDHYNYPELYDMGQSVALYERMVVNKKRRRPLQSSNSQHSLKSTGSATAAAAATTTLSGPDARALTKLARVYYEGDHQGQSKDLEKAYQYARRVAEGTGEKYCQFVVGDILLQQKDVRQSLFWLAQSGQQGFPLAIEALARIYFEGMPPLLQQDYELAHEWCLKGDDIWPSGLGYCQSCLGDMYRQGLGVPKDQMKSFEYYQKAASQQDAPQNYARYMLGEMFYHGDGWIRNIPVAKDYYQIAAQEQYEPARQRLSEIEAYERKQYEESLIPRKSNRPWRIMSLFSGRRKIST